MGTRARASKPSLRHARTWTEISSLEPKQFSAGYRGSPGWTWTLVGSTLHKTIRKSPSLIFSPSDWCFITASCYQHSIASSAFQFYMIFFTFIYYYNINLACDENEHTLNIQLHVQVDVKPPMLLLGYRLVGPTHAEW